MYVRAVDNAGFANAALERALEEGKRELRDLLGSGSQFPSLPFGDVCKAVVKRYVVGTVSQVS